MGQKARLFQNGRSQAVRLPVAYRFDDCDEVFIRRDPATGDVIISRRPANWDSFLAARQKAAIDQGFLDSEERKQTVQERDPFAEWNE
ncbi:AbrB/MazE/SpoVT family DNA-binding domain-containing protein [Pistricoccus aurantiacus]|uniref:AbrB/MazE/SpoVT family DNA-binding domain-containing protein n=1 Tax=Pistricoccus aurantiacus TaxID=1883414 RepID=A0A5B8SPQ7_9GAMM|nr:AbrB/MazE/SpoVT family DNA-binding domain-containing protein [Pistricoccus aurantiacus]QEA37997.1 AbrB/MazE/SpoVT family DNA-binding domain-containing protein [Pistricoccus aurantiacus]